MSEDGNRVEGFVRGLVAWAEIRGLGPHSPTTSVSPGEKSEKRSHSRNEKRRHASE